MNKFFMTLVFVLSGLLAGCGGGGSDPISNQAVVEAPPFTVETSPVAQYVPQNAIDIFMVGARIQATNETLDLTQVEFTRTGYGNSREIQSIYMDPDDTRPYQYDSRTGKAVANFPSGSFSIKKGSSIQFDLNISLSGVANSNHSFALTGIEVNGKKYIINQTVGLLNVTSYVIPKQ